MLELTVRTDTHNESHSGYTSSVFNLKKDNMPLWNSWYTMPDWMFLRAKDAVAQYTSIEKNLDADILNGGDGMLSKHIQGFLCTFYHVTSD